MPLPVTIRRIIDDSLTAYGQDCPFDVCARLGELLAATSAGLCNDTWRTVLPPETVAYIERREQEIQEVWRANLSRLDRVLSYGPGLDYEEMLLVLTLRSDLEFVAACRPGVREHSPLREVDGMLRERIQSNRRVWLDCRRRVVDRLYASLPSHWWWHSLENAAGEEKRRNSDG
jgi:hypothetical protein